MRSLEVHPNLREGSIVLIESKVLANGMAGNCIATQRMNPRKVYTYTEVPENLLELMEEEGIDSAIIHPSRVIEGKYILKAHKAGKKIVVISRDPPATFEEWAMYGTLEEAGIPTVGKSMDSFSEALNLLSGLFQENRS